MHHSTFYILPSTLFRPFFILHCSFFIILSLFIAGCTKSTSPKTGSLSGRVILVNDTGDTSLDPVDFSGVTVALYELAVLDTTIVRINQEYPLIGVQISQETEFDHRNYNPISVVQTDATGNFQFRKIPHGIYNLLAFKEGWGYKYLYSVVIDNEVNSISIYREERQDYSRNNDLVLHPARMLPSFIDYPLTLREGRVYIVSQNTNVFSQVVVEPYSKLLIAANTKIDFHSSISTPTDGSTWLITVSDGIYSTEKKVEIASFDQVGFYLQESLNLHGMIFEHSLNGVKLDSPQSHIEKCVIRKNQNHAILCSGSSASIQQLVVSFNPLKGITAFNNFELSSSIVHSNRDACFLSESNGMVRNSYFCNNYIAVRPFYGDISIKNNCFDQNKFSLSPCASNPLIKDNNFYDNLCDIELNGYYTHVDNDYCDPNVEGNNFYGDGWYIHLKGINSVYGDGYGARRGVDNDQVYPLNYLIEVDLTNHVYDASIPNSGVSYSVLFSPRRNVPNQLAGLMSP